MGWEERDGREGGGCELQQPGLPGRLCGFLDLVSLPLLCWNQGSRRVGRGGGEAGHDHGMLQLIGGTTGKGK